MVARKEKRESKPKRVVATRENRERAKRMLARPESNQNVFNNPALILRPVKRGRAVRKT